MFRSSRNRNIRDRARGVDPNRRRIRVAVRAGARAGGRVRGDARRGAGAGALRGDARAVRRTRANVGEYVDARRFNGGATARTRVRRLFVGGDGAFGSRAREEAKRFFGASGKTFLGFPEGPHPTRRPVVPQHASRRRRRTGAFVPRSRSPVAPARHPLVARSVRHVRDVAFRDGRLRG